jgi:alanyl-tRNA synthetase
VVGGKQGPIDRLRPLAQALSAMPRALFVGWTADPPALLVAASTDSGLDAGRLLRSSLERVGGRGGGNPGIAQGTTPTVSAMEAALTDLAPARA